ANTERDIVSFYQTLLKRTPSTSEIEFWKNEPTPIKKGISQSKEFKKKNILLLIVSCLSVAKYC
ncbi:MAG: DUF4214 domain-containing protein, partial [Nanoarchaeota archaeon]|nr:DUF4214 domain-containing protein [Nanoarchaeota archaeon]